MVAGQVDPGGSQPTDAGASRAATVIRNGREATPADAVARPARAAVPDAAPASAAPATPTMALLLIVMARACRGARTYSAHREPRLAGR
jgi:hypothetical protein